MHGQTPPVADPRAAWPPDAQLRPPAQRSAVFSAPFFPIRRHAVVRNLFHPRKSLREPERSPPVPPQRSHPPVGMRPQHSPTSATHLRSADRQCYNRFQPCRPFVVRQRLPASDLPIRRNSGPQKCLFRPSRSFICDDPPASSVRSCRPPPVRRAAVPHVRSARHHLRYCPIRCRTTSKSITAAAAETLSDSICPISGMASCSSQSLSTSFEIPRSSAPITSTVGRRKSAS